MSGVDPTAVLPAVLAVLAELSRARGGWVQFSREGLNAEIAIEAKGIEDAAVLAVADVATETDGWRRAQSGRNAVRLAALMLFRIEQAGDGM